MIVPHFDSLGLLFRHYVPEYHYKRYKPFIASFDWDSAIADEMQRISQRRVYNRLSSYIIPGEFERSSKFTAGRGCRAFRFGYQKGGNGLHGTRGDFCLVGGAYEKKKLTVFYRSLDLIGGLHYDTAIFAAIEKVVGPVRVVTIMAVSAEINAMRGNSNEKLYAKLVDYYNPHSLRHNQL